MCEVLIGFGSAVIGGGLALLGVYLTYRLNKADREKLDEPRRNLLRQMLDKKPDGWRRMETLSRVIGADRDATARLLIEIGARGNEKDSGNDVWGYIKNHPLPDDTAQSK